MTTARKHYWEYAIFPLQIDNKIATTWNITLGLRIKNRQLNWKIKCDYVKRQHDSKQNDVSRYYEW